MGSIKFESKERAVYAGGSSRDDAEKIIQNMTSAVLDTKNNKYFLSLIIPYGHYMADLEITSPDWAEAFETALFDGSLRPIVQGKEIDPFALVLNTASALGSDAVKMIARIHAQCEIHGFVKGENRAWMADIIENSPIDVFHPDKRWRDVVELLRESDEGPVVMSYSVTDDFLDSAGDEWQIEWKVAPPYGTFEEAEDAWEALSHEEQWDYAVKWLYTKEGFEITPNEWPIAFSGSTLTVGQMLEEV